MAQNDGFNIYQNNSRIKWVVLVVAVVISATSIYYTNLLVEEFKLREEKMIELHANILEYTANVFDYDENITFYSDILTSNTSVPLILTDSVDNILSTRNIKMRPDITEEARVKIEKKELAVMKEAYEPILVTVRDLENDEVINYQYVYYRNSDLLSQLKYYPYIQLSVIFIFGLIVYMIFSYSKTAEQNRIWAGLAKETAHQLGTPLSSLMAWVEYFRADENQANQEIAMELDKDIKRLEMITSRFSNIGSVPLLQEENVYEIIRDTVNYLESRVSSKVNFDINTVTTETYADLNKPLFEWVIENICKNAVDAMSGVGTITINVIKANEGRVIIDISDTGKGIPKANIKKIFSPGFSTKKRGWGLGLTLVKRIINNYHKGQIFVKSSEPDAGTTFRIILKT
ncbi:ATP-binding protein [Fulvivirgaceae bacterium BMA12]|uniref:histidine kinase n=1 Tax=Agaribacillus aureus TaxID=3051825 RepID=A0ABT8L9L6_9BACT|nr:ATP-binding protein [Fulvivirgaceae bacterium BMA12]